MKNEKWKTENDSWFSPSGKPSHFSRFLLGWKLHIISILQRVTSSVGILWTHRVNIDVASMVGSKPRPTCLARKDFRGSRIPITTSDPNEIPPADYCAAVH